MEESFIDDSGIKIQLKGIENRARLLNIQCKCQIEAFSKINGVTTFGNGGGMVLGYFTKDEERLAQYLQDASSYILENVSTDDLITMQQNAIEVTEIVRPDWYKKFFNDEEVYITGDCSSKIIAWNWCVQKTNLPNLKNGRATEYTCCFTNIRIC